MSSKSILLWFRLDLRLEDHRALQAAVATGLPVQPVYILDEESPGPWAPGGASRWWLHHSLAALDRRLHTLGSVLVLRRGPARRVLPQLAQELNAQAVYCSRCYEPWAAALERNAKEDLAKIDVAFKRFGGALLREPEDVRTQTGGPFRVYSPFWRAIANMGDPGKPIPSPAVLPPPATKLASDDLQDWHLLPQKPDWAGGLRASWQPGEAGAAARLTTFLTGPLKSYTADRNRPDLEATSRLSPHLHFGEITPAMCWHAAKAAASARSGLENGLETFLKELTWREFSYHLLCHWPELPQAPFRPEFAAFPWNEDAAALTAWQRGQTGYPLVDAGMRELWHTGWMHNRVRMVVASLLMKHLLIPWQTGESWFWDTLVDADLASNAASWQWVAGSGADAAPYFRIFNPVKQGETFDPDGAYVRRWVPELRGLPNTAIHAPWLAPASVLQDAGVTLGKTYPMPIVDHAAARARALSAYETVKSAASSTR